MKLVFCFKYIGINKYCKIQKIFYSNGALVFIFIDLTINTSYLDKRVNNYLNVRLLWYINSNKIWDVKLSMTYMTV